LSRASKWNLGRARSLRRITMNVFAVALLFFTAVFLGGVLVVVLVALFKVRRSRQERLQMKRHLQKIGA